MIIGGVAVIAAGVPRETVDIDATILGRQSDLHAVVDSLARHDIIFRVPSRSLEHLLTREAMDLYFRHLQPDGILAVHISNRYLNLQPVLQGETSATQKIARVVDTEDDDTQGVFGATWVLVTSPVTGFKGEEMSNSAPLDSSDMEGGTAL